MEGRTRVLGFANGSLDARILFVAEAPGRLGADVTGIPLSGDRTGKTFNSLLEAAGIRRSDVFVTNAVLCNPRDDDGRNDRPTTAEMRRCSQHLSRLVEILDPAWVVTLGTVALDAVARIETHDLVLRRDVGKPSRWNGRQLVALYHPGPRALIHRPHAVQRQDYVRLAALIDGQVPPPS
jgi:uracil-DNA glycosylase family 4